MSSGQTTPLNRVVRWPRGERGERGERDEGALSTGMALGGGWPETMPLARSPLRRAGLLQPYGYNPSNEHLDSHARHTDSHINRLPQPHSQDTIRQSSITLSNMPNMPLSRSPASILAGSPSTSTGVPYYGHLLIPQSSSPRPGGEAEGTKDDGANVTPEDRKTKPSALTLLRPGSEHVPSSGTATTSIMTTETDTAAASVAMDQIPTISLSDDNGDKSNLGGTFQVLSESAHERGPPHEGESNDQRNEAERRETDSGNSHTHGSERSTALTTPTLGPNSTSPTIDLRPTAHSDPVHSGHEEAQGSDSMLGREPSISRKDTETTERMPLLAKLASTPPHVSYDGRSGADQVPLRAGSLQLKTIRYVFDKIKSSRDTFSKSLSVYTPKDIAMTALRAIPAVLLGSLLNILDAVSYGMIIFPSTGVFSGLGPMGVSIFFVTTIISQLAYTLGGSGFAGANGSMMIEVVPFFHIMANSIADQIGEDHPRRILATTLAAYALSSILTGIAFLLLGALKLGVVVGFFPRHILVGCIGGVGVFLILTGITTSLRLDDSSFNEAPWETICYMFSDTHDLSLWLVPLTLAVLLRIITHRCHHQLIFPLYFIVIPLLFYIVVLAARLNLDDLRDTGWLFDVGKGSDVAWYQFYSYFDFGLIQYAPLWRTLPTQFALLFFNILHPPLNVPALAVSLNEDVDTNKELVAHGYSNLFAGLFGTVPNYLVYINTLLFYRVGGGNRIAGFLLALATFGLLLMGTGPIAYLPVMVVGALIFVLGIDLVKEALWDTRNRASRTEYLTILSIVICMTVWDFVIGVLFGIIISCVFFVVQSSQRKSIRTIQTAETAMSSVRRPSLQREYISEVSKQTTIIKLQGFLFFGTIAQVEDAIRCLIDAPSWKHNPIRFLVVDLLLVAGVDMSSAEAFVRIHRLLYNKGITLVFCGIQAESAVGKALSSVDVLGANGVELFSNLNDALEWTENEYLRAWYNSQKAERAVVAYDIPSHKRPDSDLGSMVQSPRHAQIRDAATRTLAHETRTQERIDIEEPFKTLRKVFSTFGDISYSELSPLKSYLERLTLPPGHVLWRQEDPPDGLYILESGVLKAIYKFAENTQEMEETMFPGTLAGELSGLSETPRNATVVVERPAVLWKLSSENLRRLRREESDLATAFTHLVLKSAKRDYDILLSALASRQ